MVCSATSVSHIVNVCPSTVLETHFVVACEYQQLDLGLLMMLQIVMICFMQPSIDDLWIGVCRHVAESLSELHTNCLGMGHLLLLLLLLFCWRF